MSAIRKAARVVNTYDTWNGILLETSLHTAFDSYRGVRVKERKGTRIWKTGRQKVKLHVGQSLSTSTLFHLYLVSKQIFNVQHVGET